MRLPRLWHEMIITPVIKLTGYSAIVFVVLILVFLLTEGLPTFREVSLTDLFSQRWYPIESYYGLLPLLAGSLLVTVGATIIALPLGIGTALFIAEIAPRWMREILKPFIEIMAGVPSVVLGFIGFLVLAPTLRVWLNIATGLTALAGAILLAAISIPTIVSVAEDALDAVPRSYRDAALAVGANQWQTIWKVTLPAARNGVLTAVMLGIGRAIGETMTVMMVTGNAPVLPTRLSALFQPARTMTATIAAEMGEVATDSTHYHVLFFIGIMLFLISLAVNLIAFAVIFRQKKRAERILS
ncbi:MAG: phosphate ABC transporter permease subunit PstC [Chloroflexi bacterium RBG_16_52_11]|nr:MAG: phosphate ABC transporter permease subunit PstC [Chloroflexi bacterium RBG_16_52_11]